MFETSATKGVESPLLSAIQDKDKTPVYLDDLLEATTASDYYMYTGSLTTPPCWETVSWYILKTPQAASEDQIKFFTEKWAGDKKFADGRGNNRET
jgi:carbonic anhydrase